MTQPTHTIRRQPGTMSMTGFARQDRETELGQLNLEIRSVNHRYLEITLRIPEELRRFESLIREQIGQQVKRGKIELTIRFKPKAATTDMLTLNFPLVQSMLDTTQHLQQTHRQVTFSKINALEILRWPGVIQETEMDLNPLQQAVLELLDQGLQALLEARAREGQQLEQAVRTRLQAMRKQIQQVQQFYPEALQALRDKLNQRLADMDLAVNSERLEQELVIQAQKQDIAEEIDRLNTHLDEMDNILDRSEPIGRRLDFLVQELNREANTLGSKSNTVQSTQIAVELKVLLEQIREQIQNIE